MSPVESIGKLGFRRWYERQLIEGHAWLVTCVLCLLAITVVLEELSFRRPLAQVLAYGVFVFAGGLLAIYGFTRYRQLMEQAERLGEHSTCARCGTYARFSVLSGTTVECRSCSNRWNLVS